MCVLLCRAPVPSRVVALDQMKAVYLPSPEPIIFHSRLIGEIIRHVQFLSTDRELPLPADTPPKYSSLASLANTHPPHPPCPGSAWAGPICLCNITFPQPKILCSVKPLICHFLILACVRFHRLIAQMGRSMSDEVFVGQRTTGGEGGGAWLQWTG